MEKIHWTFRRSPREKSRFWRRDKFEIFQFCLLTFLSPRGITWSMEERRPFTGDLTGEVRLSRVWPIFTSLFYNAKERKIRINECILVEFREGERYPQFPVNRSQLVEVQLPIHRLFDRDSIRVSMNINQKEKWKIIVTHLSDPKRKNLIHSS